MKNTGDGRPVKGKLLQDEDGIWHEVPVSSMSIPKKPEKFDADHLPAPGGIIDRLTKRERQSTP